MLYFRVVPPPKYKAPVRFSKAIPVNEYAHDLHGSLH
jgi:hypothetical protein